MGPLGVGDGCQGQEDKVLCGAQESPTEMKGILPTSENLIGPFVCGSCPDQPTINSLSLLSILPYSGPSLQKALVSSPHIPSTFPTTSSG